MKILILTCWLHICLKAKSQPDICCLLEKAFSKLYYSLKEKNIGTATLIIINYKFFFPVRCLWFVVPLCQSCGEDGSLTDFSNSPLF